jgi:hypothetical protein
VCSMPVCQIQGKAGRCSVQHACMSDKSKAARCTVVCSMTVCPIQCKAVRCSVQHACVSDTRQCIELGCAACLYVRYNARQ